MSQKEFETWTGRTRFHSDPYFLSSIYITVYKVYIHLTSLGLGLGTVKWGMLWKLNNTRNIIKLGRYAKSEKLFLIRMVARELLSPDLKPLFSPHLEYSLVAHRMSHHHFICMFLSLLYCDQFVPFCCCLFPTAPSTILALSRHSINTNWLID